MPEMKHSVILQIYEGSYSGNKNNFWEIKFKQDNDTDFTIKGFKLKVQFTLFEDTCILAFGIQNLGVTLRAHKLMPCLITLGSGMRGLSNQKIDHKKTKVIMTNLLQVTLRKPTQ